MSALSDSDVQYFRVAADAAAAQYCLVIGFAEGSEDRRLAIASMNRTIAEAIARAKVLSDAGVEIPAAPLVPLAMAAFLARMVKP